MLGADGCRQKYNKKEGATCALYSLSILLSSQPDTLAQLEPFPIMYLQYVSRKGSNLFEETSGKQVNLAE